MLIEVNANQLRRESYRLEAELLALVAEVAGAKSTQHHRTRAATLRSRSNALLKSLEQAIAQHEALWVAAQERLGHDPEGEQITAADESRAQKILYAFTLPGGSC